MTGLSPADDALIEVAALVTDDQLNVLGDGVDVVIKASDEALGQMGEFVRRMHTSSGLLTELDHGMDMADAEQAVLGLKHEVDTLGQEVRNQGRHADAEVDVAAVFEFLGGTGRHLIACQ